MQVLIFSPPDLAKEVAKKLFSFRGGGVLILTDFPALLRLFPSQLLAKELTLDPPQQVLVERTIQASDGYDRFRAWNF